MDNQHREIDSEEQNLLTESASEILLADSSFGVSTSDGRAALLHFARAAYTRTDIFASDGSFDIPAIFPGMAGHALENGSKSNEIAIRQPIEAITLPQPPINDLEGQRRRISELARASFTPQELREFESMMLRFEARNLAREEVAQTYAEISRLLSSGTALLSVHERRQLAMQIMHNAATPTDITQGRYNTCTVAALESILYTRNPAIAARLVTDVALTGRYTATDGSVVKIDPRPQNAHGITTHRDQAAGRRSHASEIFQTTAVNAFYSSRGDGVSYFLEPPVGDSNTGERLVTAFGRLLSNSPGLSDADVLTVGRLITGSNSIRMIHTESNGNPDATVDVARTREELLQLLMRRSAEGALPLIVRVNAFLEPIANHRDSLHPRMGRLAAHVVTVTAFHPGDPPRVELDNQWERADDLVGPRAISVDVLWRLMQDGPSALVVAQRQVDALRAGGSFDADQEVALLRLQARFGTMSREELVDAFDRVWTAYAAHCNSGGCSPRDQEIRETLILGPMTAHDEALRNLRLVVEYGLVSQDRMQRALAELLISWERQDATRALEGHNAVHAFIQTLPEAQRIYIEEMRRWLARR
ncbi:MAG: hypothetical protein IT343_09090 [Candidatus Melainabacteria bacterium]|nr:hypothetical protein [Candidatus Melainabacteria bacterium]